MNTVTIRYGILTCGKVDINELLLGDDDKNEPV
jgi:hypothetical protein